MNRAGKKCGIPVMGSLEDCCKGGCLGQASKDIVGGAEMRNSCRQIPNRFSERDRWFLHREGLQFGAKIFHK